MQTMFGCSPPEFVLFTHPHKHSHIRPPLSITSLSLLSHLLRCCVLKCFSEVSSRVKKRLECLNAVANNKVKDKKDGEGRGGMYGLC